MQPKRFAGRVISFQPRTIQSRLFVFALLLSVPAALGTVGLLAWLYHAQKAIAIQQLEFIARAVSLAVDGQIDQAEVRLRGLAGSPSLHRGDIAGFEREARASLRPPQGWIMLRPVGGMPLIDTSVAPGQPLAEVPLPAETENAVHDARVVISGQLPELLTEGRRLLVSIAVPSANGDRYVLSQAVAATGVLSLLQSQHLPNAWVATILDKNRTVFAGTRGSADLAARPVVTAAVAASADGTMDATFLDNESATLAWSRSRTTDLTAVVAIPHAAVASAARSSALVAAVLGIVLVIASIAISRRLARGITRPVEVLAAMAEALGKRRPVLSGHSGLQEIDLVSDAMVNASAGLLDQDDRLQQKKAITEQLVETLQQAHDELNMTNFKLEARIDDEVAARRHAQSRAAQAERMHALGQLAGGVAHDFNNVLQAVIGGISLIRRRLDNPALDKLACVVEESAQRGAAVTRRLLAFARRGELKAEPVDAAELLAGLQEVLRHTLGAEIHIEVEASAELPPILADRGELEAVLINLAANARDAMPDGGNLRISAAMSTAPEELRLAVDAAASYLCISVSDNGVGIANDMIDHVTEPFFTTKDLDKGIGLGLAMAHGFAEQSGGVLAIASVFGQGTTVALHLPTTEAAVRDVASDGLPDRYGTLRGATARVLLVDDDPLVRSVFAEGLIGHGFSVLQADGGRAALDVIKTGAEFDVLVTDRSMPCLDGVSLIREAQKLRPALPALLVTGYVGDLANLNHARLAIDGRGAASFDLLRKPVSGDLLARRVAALFNGVIHAAVVTGDPVLLSG